jgi:hypothetical protein
MIVMRFGLAWPLTISNAGSCSFHLYNQRQKFKGPSRRGFLQGMVSRRRFPVFQGLPGRAFGRPSLLEYPVKPGLLESSFKKHGNLLHI